MLGYIEPEEAKKIYRSVFGGNIEITDSSDTDPSAVLKGIQTSLKELQYV
jgi:hypothetical protein